MDTEPEDTVFGRLMGFVTGCIFAAMWFGILLAVIWHGEDRVRFRGRGMDDAASLAATVAGITWFGTMAWAFKKNLSPISAKEMQKANRAQWRADTGAGRNDFAGWALILPLISAGAFLSAFGFKQSR
jgi:hypothetical protein